MTEFQLSYLKSKKMMLLKCCTQYASKFGKLSSGHRDWKRSIPKKGNANKCSNSSTLVFNLHAGKVMLKILQVRLQQYVNWELQMYKLGLEKAKESEIKLPTFVGSWRKQGNFRKASASLTMLKPLIVWITTNCGKFLKRWEYQTILPVSEKPVCRSKS